MPGYQVPRSAVNEKSQPDFDRYQCPNCKLLLKDAVQLICGHRLCESCAHDLLKSPSPNCPLPGCLENLEDKDGDSSYFPDRCVRTEIQFMMVSCNHHQEGCEWKDRLAKFEHHQSTCPKARVKCPLAEHGCSSTKFMLKEDMDAHMEAEMGAHVRIMMPLLAQLSKPQSNPTETENGQSRIDRNQRPSPPGSTQITDRRRPKSHFFVGTNRGPATTELVRIGLQRGLPAAVQTLQDQVDNLTAEVERSRMRLSMLESTSYNGSLLWKIPQFKQKRDDEQSSIYSVPFYTSREGYKMCLRLYILGDGIGKNTHMSLFFVIMKGEFDNILQWPFTSKVTFKLINQTGGRDITHTFQPDPMSSSFRRPRTDANIAAGYPKFISQLDLLSGGFVEDDCVFIKCFVDTTTIFHP